MFTISCDIWQILHVFKFAFFKWLISRIPGIIEFSEIKEEFMKHCIISKNMSMGLCPSIKERQKILLLAAQLQLKKLLQFVICSFI